MNRWEAYRKMIASVPAAQRAGVLKLAIFVFGVLPTGAIIAVDCFIQR